MDNQEKTPLSKGIIAAFAVMGAMIIGLTVALIVTNLPEGAKIKWKIVDGRGVTLEPSSTGLSCTVTATVNGDAVIEAYLVDKNGNRLKDIDGKTIADREGISSEVNAWMIFIWYFKRIFGLI